MILLRLTHNSHGKIMYYNTSLKFSPISSIVRPRIVFCLFLPSLAFVSVVVKTLHVICV